METDVRIGLHTFDEFTEIVKRFHGYAAPGLLIGGFMVEMARRHIPEGTLFDAIAETSSCLPDAVQLLTPCTAGNGWLRVHDLGRYALSLFDKRTGKGVRVFLDPAKLGAWPHMKTWLFKLKPKKEQDSNALREEMRQAGESVLTLRPVRIKPENLGKKSKGPIAICPLCSEAYPARHGRICLGCQGSAPAEEEPREGAKPALRAVPVEEAVGKRVLHDMTRIVPGRSKGVEFARGQEISSGDVCRLQQMGRMNVYVQEENDTGPEAEWIHEDEAAAAFARAISGEGLDLKGKIHEGKANLVASRDGLLVVDEEKLEAFNLVPDVMAATVHNYTVVRAREEVAGTRAIPLVISRAAFHKAMTVIGDSPILSVRPMRQGKIGVLVTGTEVFQGLIQDKFIPIITDKAEEFGSKVVKSLIRPDDKEMIRQGIGELVEAGADLIVTTAGLSVDPDDVTRQALLEAGVTDILYGAPLLPGTMTLLAKLGRTQVMGVPACALFFKTTSLDLLLPRLLAGVEITRHDLAKLGHGGYCKGCTACTYPKCSFGK